MVGRGSPIGCFVVVAPAPSVVHRDSALQPDLLPPSEVVRLVGVSRSTVAVPDCVAFFLLLVLTLQFAVLSAFPVLPTASCLLR